MNIISGLFLCDSAHPEVIFPNLGIHMDKLDRVFFSIGNFSIYKYGAIIGFGIILAILLMLYEAKRSGQNVNDYVDFASFAVILSVIGARAYYVIFSWNDYKDNLIKIFAIREGGLAIYGGVLTGIILGIVYCRKKGIPFWRLADTVLPSVLLGQILGRWGNFFNREAFGGFTDGLFAMQYIKDQVPNISASVAEHIININGMDYIQVHPTFLYESCLNLVLLIILLILRKNKKFDGEIGSLYLAGYGLIRFFVEGLRSDQLIFFNTGIAVSQMVSLVLFILGVTFFCICRKKGKGDING